MTVDPDSLTKSYTESILAQCDLAESQLKSAGLDHKFSRLISIQAAYNTMKQLLIELDDLSAQEELFKIFENDIKQITFTIKPNVFTIGHA